jgi:DNA repair protein RadC
MTYNHEVAPAGIVREVTAERFDAPVASLRNEELLAALVNVPIDKARKLIQDHTLAGLANEGYHALQQITTARRARILLAAFELSRRAFADDEKSLNVISSPTDVLPLLWDIRSATKEHFLALLLNARHHLIHRETVSIGSLTASMVHPRELFCAAIQHHAASIILCHNHPSGDTTPSQDDIELTRRLTKAGEILGIEILDHVIVAGDNHLSLKERGLI